MYEVLDVVGTNIDGYDTSGMQAVSRRCDDVPHPSASDHRPVSLRWFSKHRKKRRKNTAGVSDLIRTPIPLWLLQNNDFVSALDREVHQWLEKRSSGFEGLKEFTELVHDFAQTYLETHLVIAKTAAHRLEVTVAMMNTLRADRVNEQRVSRLCGRYPALQEIVILRTDLSTGRSTVSESTKAAVGQKCRELADEVIRERTREAEDAAKAVPAETKSIRGYEMSSELLRKMKALQKGKRQQIHEIWNPETGTFETMEEEMAEIIKAARRAVEVVQDEKIEKLEFLDFEKLEIEDSDSSDEEDEGEELLRDWGVNFSDCRTKLARHEVDHTF